MGDRLPEMSDQQPLPVESTVLRQLPHFQIIQRLGVGGMGHVHQARDLDFGVEIALKIIRPENSQNPEAHARFHREVRIAHRITHPNVCRTYDLDQEIRSTGSDPSRSSAFVFLTMEYLYGETLQQLLKRRGRLEIAEAMLIASHVAKGLSAAHEAGIVHRDHKPSNVMIIFDECSGSKYIDRAVLTDFGLARFETATEANDASTISLPKLVGSPSRPAQEYA
jgi:serine/threonine protein kinase